MSDGMLISESRPASSTDEAAYHEWYETAHLPEILQIEGFVSARRLRATEGDTYIVIYEIEGDVDDAKRDLAAAQAAGSMTRPSGVQLDPSAFGALLPQPGLTLDGPTIGAIESDQ